MTTKVILKKSSVSGKVPTDSDLVYGEVALNFTDGRLYYKDNNNVIQSFIDSDLINTAIDAKLAASGVGDSGQVTTLITGLVDSDYIQLRQSYNADTLDGQDGLYYLDYTNFTNTPNVLDSADIRNIFSAAGDLTYNPSTGEFSIDVESVYTKANFDSDLDLAFSTNAVTTTDLSEGSNLYYTTGRVDSDIDARVTKSFVDNLNVDADTLDGQDGTYYLDYANFTNTPNVLDSADVLSTVAADGYTKFDSANASGLITTAINNLVDGAPAALDTLNELAAAIGDDSDFIGTITTLVNNLPDSAQVSSIITSDVDKAFVDALNVDADTLDGQHGSYYLDYNNFVNTPNVLDSADVAQIVTAGSIDSSQITSIVIDTVDSDYIQLRQSYNANTLNNRTAADIIDESIVFAIALG